MASSSNVIVAKIWDHQRIIKKSFIFTGNINALIKKANDAGILGSKLVLESDGTEVDDVEVIEYFCKKLEIFQLIPLNFIWMPPGSVKSNLLNSLQTSNTVQPNMQKTNDIVCWVNNSPSEISNNSILDLPKIEPPNSTISIKSEAIHSNQSENLDHNVSGKPVERLFTNYQIPINKMPGKINDLLNQEKPLGRYFKDFIHFVVDDMRNISIYIPRAIFRNIASLIAESFPKSVGVVDNKGKLICVEPFGIATKMVYRNSYLNRTGKSFSSKLEKKKIKLSDGVPNFYEKKNDESYSTENAEMKRIWLKGHFSVNTINQKLKNEALENFRYTFSAQRKFLVNNPTILEIEKHWPHLLLSEFLLLHFSILMDIQLNTFSEKWKMIKTKIINFAKNSKKYSHLNFKKIEDLNILEIITSHFNENMEMMIKIFPAGTTQDEIETLSTAPFFAVVDTDYEKKNIFYFLIENKIINVDCKSVKNAVEIIIAAYFVFNIEYPEELSQSLEVIQKLFFDIKANFSHCNTKKQTLNNRAKVGNFLNKIFQC